MKKSIVVLGLMFCASVASADDNITLYGMSIPSRFLDIGFINNHIEMEKSALTYTEQHCTLPDQKCNLLIILTQEIIKDLEKTRNSLELYMGEKNPTKEKELLMDILADESVAGMIMNSRQDAIRNF